MSHLLTLLWAFIVAHQEQLIEAAATIIGSTIVTAMTKYPNLRGPVGVAMRIIDALSVVVHKDSPDTGTFKGLVGKLLNRLSLPGFLSPLPVVNGVNKPLGVPATPDVPKVPVMMLLVAGLALSSLACVPSSITAARKSIAIADQVQTSSIKSFELWDLAHQKTLTPAERTDYRARREPVIAAFEALAAASQAAKQATDAAASKVQTGKVDLAPVLSAIIYAARALRDAAAAIGYTIPGLSTLIGVTP